MTDRPPLLDRLQASVVRRAAWGAPSAVGWPVEGAPVRALVIHHTGTANDDPDPLATVARIERFHAVERGWGDIGYSFLVLEDGCVVEGREGSADAIAPWGVVGGHVYGHNPGTVGIALVGRFHEAVPTVAAWQATVDLVASICHTCGLDPQGGPVELPNGARLPHVISGHGDARDTTCPGAALHERLPALRAAVAASLSSSAGAPP